MYLAQVSRYDILYAVNQLARGIPRPSKAYIGATNLLRYLAGSADFSIAYTQRGFKLATFSDANWGNNPDNGKSTSSYIVMLANGPIGCNKVGLQDLTTQPIMEAELMVAALTIKEAAFCKNMMAELRFKDGFDRVPLYIDNMSALRADGDRTYSTRAKNIALIYTLVQELVEGGTITIHHVKTQNQLRRHWD